MTFHFKEIQKEKKWDYTKQHKIIYGCKLHGQNIIKVPLFNEKEIIREPPPGFEHIDLSFIYIKVPIPVPVLTISKRIKGLKDFDFFCGNCNKRGHLYKNCINEIISYGIIAYRNINTNCKKEKLKELGLNQITKKENRILLVQRKDTMAYVEFLRARYPDDTINKKYYILTLFREMIPEERNKIKSLTFDELWDELWINHNSKCYKSEKEDCKKKFYSVDHNWFISMCFFQQNYTFTEFGIPKGRKNKYESDLECAIREFSEETGYSQLLIEDCFKDFYEKPFITESFIGTNGKKYKHVYFIVELPESLGDPVLDSNNKNQIGEVKDILWFSEEECIKVTREYDFDKLRVFNSVFSFLNEIKK